MSDKKQKVGLYLGINSIAAVVVENRKIVKSIYNHLTSLDDETQIESLNEEVRWQAIVNKTLRDLGVANAEIYLSLADRDFIYRSFDMPSMSNKQIKSSLIFEVEKHIPFKVDELNWDYSYVNLVKEKKVRISFLGVIDKHIAKFRNVFKQLGETPVAIESSSISLVRLIKAQKETAKLMNFAVLDLTLDEAYLTFYNHDLPVFNRYLSLPAKEGKLDEDKFFEAVRLSFQYFKREFKQYSLDKLIIVSKDIDAALITTLKEELQLEVSLLSLTGLVGKSDTSVDEAKALGVVERATQAYKFKPVLRAVIHDQAGAVSAPRPVSVKLNVGLLVAISVVGCIAIGMVWMYFENQLASEKTIYKNELAKIVYPPKLKGLDTDTMRIKIENEAKSVDYLHQTLNTVKKLSPFFDEVAILMPKGLWLKTFRVSKGEKNYQGSIEGFIVLYDAYKESRSLDDFIKNLRENEKIKAVFPKINLLSSQRKNVKNQQQGYGEKDEDVLQGTYFNIKLEGDNET